MDRRIGAVLVLAFGTLIFRGSLASPHGQELQQVNEHKQIDSKQAEAEPRLAPEDLDDFERQERSSDDQGKVFCPDLLEIEPYAFDIAYGVISKRQYADTLKDGIVQKRCPIENDVNQARLRIEAEMVGQRAKLVTHIFM